MKYTEILAPAGSMEALKAAVYCGANAVYLGGKEFNARRNADNFDFTELKDAVSFCHERNCKVYETVNILMLPGEEKLLLKSLEDSCKAGVDALIIQDLGVLSIVKKACPQMKCHASTQMAVHNLEGVLEAEKMGLDLAVLARELSREEIKYIADNSPIPVECFVHGAHCMSVSGQCYLSSVIGERSGNRGLCAQPCRLPFNLGNSSYCLSLKDMSLVNRASELRDLGVASLKIEGRMKRPEYVAAAVTSLKAALEGREPNLEDLRKVFSRSGFTDGFYTGKRDISMFGIRQKEDVTAASDVLKDLGKLCNKETPLVPLEGEFYAEEGENIIFKASDGVGHIAYIEGDVAEKALKTPTDREHILTSLNKTGGTPYFFKDIDLDFDDDLMIKASQLNFLRREAVERISQKRKEVKEIPFRPVLPNLTATMKTENKEIRIRCFKDQLSPYIINNCHKLIMPNEDYKAALSMGCPPEKIIVQIPRIDFTKGNNTDRILKEASSLGIKDVWAGNVGSIHMAQKYNMKIHGGWSLNIANNYAAEALRSLGVTDAEISPELNIFTMDGITSIRKGIIAYGSLPLMTFRNCPVKSRIGCEKCRQKSFLTDRMGVEFPVTCKSSHPEMLNSVPIYLADRFNETDFLDFVTLWFTLEDRKECEDMLKEYLGKKPAQRRKNGYTRGLYYRKIK